jgi:hypothetical protein
LNCFCAGHDNQVFSHIENDELTFDTHQLTLLQYRSLASELYRKVTADEQKRKKPKNRDFLEFLRAHAAGTLAGVGDVGTAFDECATNLFAAKYDEVSALVVHFKKLPSIMTVGGFLAQFDYSGQRIQLISDLHTIAQIACFNILAASDRRERGRQEVGRQLRIAGFVHLYGFGCSNGVRVSRKHLHEQAVVGW